MFSHFVTERVCVLEVVIRCGFVVSIKMPMNLGTSNVAALSRSSAFFFFGGGRGGGNVWRWEWVPIVNWRGYKETLEVGVCQLWPVFWAIPSKYSLNFWTPYLPNLAVGLPDQLKHIIVNKITYRMSSANLHEL